jgi:choline dehydrogenase-like flavoprotein
MRVLIVGAGPAGGMAAKHFLAAGYAVTCLEQGEWHDPSVYPGDRPENELLARQRWHWSPNRRQTEADYPINDSQSDVGVAMFNGVGGSTVLWGAHWHRLAPSDFAVRTLDGIADDWPLTYGELVPFYEEADADMAASGADGDPAWPPPHRFPLPAFPLGKAGHKLVQGMNRLGWHWWPGSNAIASRAYRHFAACARLGVCTKGCPEGAKAVADRAFWFDAVDAGARLVTGARVKEVALDEAGLATGAHWIDRSGDEHFEHADIVVLCANGIGTARILLMSRSDRFPDGLANSSGLVGRNLMMHPHSVAVGVFDDQLENWVGPGGLSAYSMQFYESDPARGFVRGAKWSASVGGGPLQIHPGLTGAPLERGWGATAHRKMLDRLGKSASWAIVGEDLPNPENRIELTDEVTDSDGLPGVKVSYRLGENDLRLREWHLDRAVEALEAAGAHQTIRIPVMPFSGGHMLGTARMGHDPAKSVTNPFGRTHDVGNLYIFDGSLFVTAGGVNPTATICALASRGAQHLIAQYGTGDERGAGSDELV